MEFTLKSGRVAGVTLLHPHSAIVRNGIETNDRIHRTRRNGHTA